MKSIKLAEGINYGQLLKKTDLDFAWISLTTYGEFDQYETHYHENPYLSLVVKGGYTERNKKEIRMLRKGELVFRPAAYDHSNAFVGEAGACFNIEFKQEWSRLLEFRLPKDFSVFDWGTHPQIQKALYQFISTGEEIHIKETIFNWLHAFNKPVSAASKLLWVEQAKKIIESECEQPHSLETLAARLHIHPIYFAGCFKKKTGLTVGEYLMQERLRKADALLLRTKRSVTEIAHNCGFYDTAHFIKTFVKIYGVAPGKFRRIINS